MKSTRCAACKYMRKRCPPDCAFSPYFPSNDPEKYASVHKIYGAGNVLRMLRGVPVHLRGDAADAMSIEAQCRIKDPVYGCVKIISQLENDINLAKNELAKVQAEVTLLAASLDQGIGFDPNPSFDYYSSS